MRKSENNIYRVPGTHIFMRLYPVCKVNDEYFIPKDAMIHRVVTDNWHVQNKRVILQALFTDSLLLVCP